MSVLAPGWLHEIKHDGMRIMARRDAGVRLITRHGNEFTAPFPVVVAPVTAARSFLDREAVVTNGDGSPCLISFATSATATLRYWLPLI